MSSKSGSFLGKFFDSFDQCFEKTIILHYLIFCENTFNFKESQVINWYMPFSHESINFVRHENRYEFLWVRVIASLYSKRAVQVMCNQSDKKVRHLPKIL